MKRFSVGLLMVLGVTTLAWGQKPSNRAKAETTIATLRVGFQNHQGYKKEISSYTLFGKWTEVAVTYQSADRQWGTQLDNLQSEPNGYLHVSVDGDEAIYDMDDNNNPYDNISDGDGDDTTLIFRWARQGVVLFSDEHLTKEDRDDNTYGYRALLCRLVDRTVDLGVGENKTMVCQDKEEYACRAYAPRDILQTLRIFQIIVRA